MCESLRGEINSTALRIWTFFFFFYNKQYPVFSLKAKKCSNPDKVKSSEKSANARGSSLCTALLSEEHLRVGLQLTTTFIIDSSLCSMKCQKTVRNAHHMFSEKGGVFKVLVLLKTQRYSIYCCKRLKILTFKKLEAEIFGIFS